MAESETMGKREEKNVSQLGNLYSNQTVKPLNVISIASCVCSLSL